MSSYFLVARGMKAEDIISATDPLEKIQAKAVIGEFKLTKKLWSHHVIWQVDDIIRALNDPGIDPTISGIRLAEKIAESSTGPKANLEISGVALFKGDKLIGWLDGDQARGFVRLTNTMKSTITMIDCNEKKNGVSIETTRSKSQIKVRIVNSKPSFYVHILEEGIVSEMNCKLPLNKAGTINDLERLWRSQIEKEVTSTINAMKKTHVDPSWQCHLDFNRYGCKTRCVACGTVGNVNRGSCFWLDLRTAISHVPNRTDNITNPQGRRHTDRVADRLCIYDLFRLYIFT